MKKIIVTTVAVALMAVTGFTGGNSAMHLNAASAPSTCEITAQVAFNDAFQAAYLAGANLGAAEGAGIRAYHDAYNQCVGNATEFLFGG